MQRTVHKATAAPKKGRERAAWLQPRRAPALAVLFLLATLYCGCREMGTQKTEADLPGPAKTPLAQRWLPLDADGWSVVKPAPDSLIFYVSSSVGDDAQATTYTATSPAVGPDPTRPRAKVHAFKTIAAAMASARRDSPDWVLLQRGDSWDGGVPAPPSGRDAHAPFVVGAYGDGRQRPELRVASGSGLSFNSKSSHDIVVTGLDFHAVLSNPDDPASRRGGGISVYSGERRRRGADAAANATPPTPSTVERLLVEDCEVRDSGGMGLSFTVRGDSSMRDVVVRRCVILDAYTLQAPGENRPSGVWSDCATVLLEENVFDHNGWQRPGEDPEGRGGGGQANVYNHNTYMFGSAGCVLRGNTFLRPSSIQNKWSSNTVAGCSHDILIENNLYVEGEIGIGMGGNDIGPLRFANIAVRNNVMLDIGRSRPTGRHLAWYLEIADWDGGLVTGNLFLHQRSDEVDAAYAILLSAEHAADGLTRNVTIRDNIVHGMRSRYAAVVVEDRLNLQNVRFENNAVQCPGLQTPLVCVAYDTTTTGLVFQGNHYWTGRPAGEWFAIARPDASFLAVAQKGPLGLWPEAEFGVGFLNFADWTRSRGETGAVARQEKYPDPNRTVETYMASLGMPATFEAFVAAVRQQSRLHWRKELTAPAVNDYIRAGFGR